VELHTSFAQLVVTVTISASPADRWIARPADAALASTAAASHRMEMRPVASAGPPARLLLAHRRYQRGETVGGGPSCARATSTVGSLRAT
jgi:hypothetical protein